MRHDVSLADRFDLTKSSVLLNGTQALVRLMLVQKERDRRAGLHTGGYVSGYRGRRLAPSTSRWRAKTSCCAPTTSCSAPA